MVLALLKPVVREVRKKEELSSLAAVIMSESEVLGETSAEELWAMGALTEAITATAVARLVEGGSLRWEATVQECLGKVVDFIHPDSRGVTIETLLSGGSGVASDSKIAVTRRPMT